MVYISQEIGMAILILQNRLSKIKPLSGNKRGITLKRKIFNTVGSYNKSKHGSKI